MELMKRILFILFVLLSVFCNGQGNYFMWHRTAITITATVPEVNTLSITAIAQTTATVNGNIINDGRQNIIGTGFCWNTTGMPTTADNTISGIGLPYFGANLIGLTVNTLYYVRALAVNSVGIGYGNQISFTTSSVTIVVPTITLQSISQDEETTANSGGNVISSGGATVTARGICWNTTGTPTTASTHTSNGTGTGMFTSLLTGLTCGYTYFVRAYATNSAGTGYSDPSSFVSQYNGDIIAIETLTSVTVGGVNYTPTNLVATKFIIDSYLAHTYTYASFAGLGVSGNNIGSLSFLSAHCQDFFTGYKIKSYPDNVTFDIIHFTSGVINSIEPYPCPTVGSNHYGGIVVYLFVSGDPGYISGQCHGIITMNEDIGSFNWYDGSLDTYASGATGIVIGTGLSNTNTIWTAYSGSDPTTQYAAEMCHLLNYEGFTDWVLPSVNELGVMFSGLHSSGHSFSEEVQYWTSTEIDNPITYPLYPPATYAWTGYFHTGTVTNLTASLKTDTHNVRAIRYF